MATFEIVLVPALQDNYMYLAHDPATKATAAVDPAEAAPILAALKARGWKLSHILNTHHHLDHIGGNAELKAATGAPIIGPKADRDRIPGIDVALGDGETYSVGSETATVFDVPGHTRGHIAFWFKSSAALFCGDVLFSIGCGRVIEGSMPEMWRSIEKLRALPDETRIYCGHEYTQSNIRFALSVDPGNARLRAKATEVDAMRKAGTPTIPALLGDERRTNPFLRADVAELKAAIGMASADPAAVFGAIRQRKDSFR
ncbi:MAG: hydroxyacylglutathione hydrolase [Alphaproteobacteria bacterium]|nr:hydroxyacylglutathione hydrolase [Alphaproteobacteria bacterium]